MVEVQNLVKSYGSLKALRGVSFSVPRGACFGLLGPNGAGKSTTISIIVGALRPDAGSVTVGGKTIDQDRAHYRRQIGYVPQDLALYEDLSASVNLEFFAALYDVPPAEAKKRADHVLGLVGLTDRAKSTVNTFSGGMKRRLNIAVAMLHNPEVIILDEPTVGVDPQSRNAIFETLAELRTQGKTLIYTTHYMEEVERMCDEIAIIDQGEVKAQGTLEQLLSTLPSRYGLTINFESEEKAEHASRVLAQVGGGTLDGCSIRFAPENLGATLGAAVACLQQNQIAFQDLITKRGSLEEVFLHQTGRSLRD
ncbi:MAG: ABC transporter ATP-binding protein [Fimbriimonas sp.]